MAKRVTAKVKEQTARFAALMAAGLTQYEIIKTMGLVKNEFEALRARFYKTLELEHEGKPTVRIYLDYVNRQGRLIRDLEDLKDRMRGRPVVDGEGKKVSKSESWASGAGAQAFVGAVKVQAQIFDKMIDVGQSLDLIRKAPKRIEYVGGKPVSEMSTEEVENQILKEVHEVKGLVDRRQSTQAHKVLAYYPVPAADEA